jgi:hypothetical protein
VNLYLERKRPSPIRTAKNPNRIRVRFRNFPGSIVAQADTAIKPIKPSAMTIRPLPPGLRSMLGFLPRTAKNIEKK